MSKCKCFESTNPFHSWELPVCFPLLVICGITGDCRSNLRNVTVSGFRLKGDLDGPLMKMDAGKVNLVRICSF